MQHCTIAERVQVVRFYNENNHNIITLVILFENMLINIFTLNRDSTPWTLQFPNLLFCYVPSFNYSSSCHSERWRILSIVISPGESVCRDGGIYNWKIIKLQFSRTHPIWGTQRAKRLVSNKIVRIVSFLQLCKINSPKC